MDKELLWDKMLDLTFRREWNSAGFRRLQVLVGGTIWQNIDWILIVSFLGIGAFLLLFPLKSAFQTGDSLSYALSARTGEVLSYPHHLLYVPLVYATHILIAPICGSCDPILAAQLLGILGAIAAVISMFLVVRKLLGSSFAGLSAALLLLISQGFWVYSTQADVYVPLLGSLALLLAVLLTHRNANLTTGPILVMAFLLALSVLLHQASALFAVVLSLYLIASQGRRGFKPWAIMMSLAGILVLGAYLLAFASVSGDKTFTGFVQFSSGYQSHPNPTWGTLDNVSPSGVHKLFRSQLWNFAPSPRGIHLLLIPLFAGGIIALAAWNLTQVNRHASYARFRALLLAWLGLYLLFFLWWVPENPKFLVVTLFPIIVLGFLALKDLNKAPRFSHFRRLVGSALVVLAAMMLVSNLTVRVLPSHISKGPDYLEASNLSMLAPPACIIGTRWDVMQNLLYYFDRKVIEVDLALLYLYEEQALPQRYRLGGGAESYRLGEGACIVVPLKYLTPAHPEVRHTGYSRPSEWLAYMGWLFDFKYDVTNRLVAAREFEVIRSSDGTLHVLLLPSKREVNGLGDLLQRLDHKINEGSDNRTNEFQRWFSTAYSGR